MNRSPVLTLLARGSADGWDVAIDERLDRSRERPLEVDGPGAYLVCRVDDLRVIEEFARRLSRSSSGDTGPLAIGWFGQGRVTLLPDNEFKDRFCLIVESPDRIGMIHGVRRTTAKSAATGPDPMRSRQGASNADINSFALLAPWRETFLSFPSRAPGAAPSAGIIVTIGSCPGTSRPARLA